MAENFLDFIGIGAPKCGTTWLATLLREHPGAFVPEGEELSFFNDKIPYFECIFHNRPKGMDWYRKQFAPALPGQKRGELSNVYLYDAAAGERIRAFRPDIKLVVSLRDPVRMIHSQFWYMKSSVSCGLQAESPEELLADPVWRPFLAMGEYGARLAPYFDLFGREQIHVILFDDLVENPKRTARELFAFLGIDPDFIPPSLLRKVNAGRVSRSEGFKRLCGVGLTCLQRMGLGGVAERVVSNKALARLYGKMNYVKGTPPISSELQARLAAFYAADVGKLQKLIGRTVRWSGGGG